MSLPHALWSNECYVLVSVDCSQSRKILQTFDILAVNTAEIKVIEGLRIFLRKTAQPQQRFYYGLIFKLRQMLQSLGKHREVFFTHVVFKRKLR